MGELTVDHIIGLHRQILAGKDDDARVLSEANLHQLVFLVNAEKDPVQAASRAIFQIVAYPSFNDGNKRTASRIANEILEQAGYGLAGSDEELFALMQKLKDFAAEPEDITQWIQRNARKTGE
jgi:prophage maintenance system killer protein